MYKPDLAPGMHWKCNIKVVKNKHIYKSVLLLTLKVVLEIESTQKMKKLWIVKIKIDLQSKSIWSDSVILNSFFADFMNP